MPISGIPIIQECVLSVFSFSLLPYRRYEWYSPKNVTTVDDDDDVIRIKRFCLIKITKQSSLKLEQ